jgi:RNA polymerase sigma-70 factor (ECF subfamily)
MYESSTISCGKQRGMSNRFIIIGWRKRWNQSLLKFLGRRVRAAVDIEDLAQETYLRLLRARDLAEVRNPQAYLLRVAGHVIAEWRDHHPPEDPLTLLDDEIGQDSTECELDADISQIRLDETLRDFSAVTRAVLLLRFRDEFSYKEIADQMSLTERQVRRHLTRGYEQLRETLES